ncbi:hypothetical protein BDF19DRAFT_423747 [Syncephalis fuscata]|nr:hypothetical protein BDF19DRAFT_423747 [Syncephalis fuscata]
MPSPPILPLGYQRRAVYLLRCYSKYQKHCFSTLNKSNDRSIISRWPLKPTWSVSSTLLTENGEDQNGLLETTQQTIETEDKRVLHRVLRLSCLNADTDDSLSRKTTIARLNRDLDALRHFVQHVQDAKIPKDTKPLARLCEWPWSPTDINGINDINDNSLSQSSSSEERNRALLKHAAQSKTLIYYDVPAPLIKSTK